MELLDQITAFGSEYAASEVLSDGRHKFSKWEVKVFVTITKKAKVETYFRVYPKAFADYKECIYETYSFKDLRKWLRNNYSGE